MGNKQEELEATVQQESYDVVAIMEMWWDDSHDWSAALDGYKLFRRDRRGRRGGEAALYVREGYKCQELIEADILGGPCLFICMFLTPELESSSHLSLSPVWDFPSACW
ncbi:mitochondrial fission process protein 1 [Limosa lapponica baueri]|uniref:Mitochondrial fission process protein 1 n=1 Tax=Limosa lapponica baueri TaxID=1758121 RepID=A0A2I0THI4_LIMLA|nr:mitochondrial fission process protein 1 [Limosa lapponica baueri]